MKEQSIEFQSLDDPLSSQIARKSLRIPVDDSDDFGMFVEEKTYRLADISLDGASVLIPDDCEWTVNDRIENCALKLREVVIKGLSGTLVHYSLELGQPARFGVRWDSIQGEPFEKLKTAFAEIRKEYLLKSQSDPELEE